MSGKYNVITGGIDMRRFINLLMSLILIVFIGGCAREKAPEPKGLGCLILDSLPSDVAKKLEINFENKIKMVGITVKKLPQDQLEISYFWQVTNRMDKFKNVYVHFADSGNNVLFQNDHEFCPKKTFEELKGKVVKEVFVVNVPQSAKGKEIFVKLGIYVPEPNGPRLKIESAGDAALDEKNTRVAVEKISL